MHSLLCKLKWWTVGAVKTSMFCFANCAQLVTASMLIIFSVLMIIITIRKGKTSLVRSLAETLPTGSAWSTPTASMSAVRSVFDRRGGAVARAFYMASNYVLQYEIRQAYDEYQQQSSSTRPEPGPVFVVDRWYNSTCAYSIGWKNTVGTSEESVDLLDASFFCWPPDLQLVPELVILLKVDDSVRKERVRLRRREQEITEPTTVNHNPWDGRLDADENLGKRILRAMERVTGPREVLPLDATSKTQEQVLQEALQVVTDRVERHYRPVDYFCTRPLEFFRWISSRLDLCDAETGIRRKHQPWAIQLALNKNDNSSSAAPSLRSVGIHSVNAAGILFFTRSGHPGGGQGGDNTSLAAMVWVGGSYPSEQQWRAEGILVESTPAECELLQTQPPNSLVAHYVACQEQEQIVSEDEEEQGKESGSQPNGVTARRYDRPATYTEDVTRLRREDPSKNAASAFRFVPLRMEVLIGGPGSPSGPQRYEWNRELQNSTNSNGWSKAREILPFSHSPKDGETLCSTKLQNRPITLALTGCHCAGKATLGKKIASTMSWLFQQELGDILRDADHVVAGGHRIGDGSGDLNAQSWDDRIHYEETTRDRQQLGSGSSQSSRIVETWHVGNLAWALMRKKAQPGSCLEDRKALVDQARTAIREHQKESVILFVHLSISVETCLSRRKAPDNSRRLPMDDERRECLELHKHMEEKGLDLLQTELEDLSIPLLVLNNSQDGESAIEESACRIVRFVHENFWRAAL
jgi:thymidylate kinase